MASDPVSPRQPQRATSSEPGTARPNPFDADDSSSRKRQRTSVSGSPILSTDTDARNTAQQALSSDMRSSDHPAPPQTPEHGSMGQDHPAEPSSSKVTTINLRNARETSEMSSSPTPQLASADIKESVEDVETDVVEVLSKDVPMPRSCTSSASPPVEVITIQDDGDDSEVQEIGFGFPHPTVSMIDPIRLFPFNDQGETLQETVQRLCTYLSRDEPPEIDVLRRVRDWLQQYLAFVKHTDEPTLLHSCSSNRAFCNSLPDISLTLATRRSALMPMTELAEVSKTILLLFAQITSALLKLDTFILEDLMGGTLAANSRPPDLYSSQWLMMFHYITSRDITTLDFGFDNGSLTSVFQPDEISQLIIALIQGSGDNLDRLLFLLNAGIPALPRLVECLPPICGTLLNISGEHLRVYRSGHTHDGHEEMARASLKLRAIHEMWQNTHNTLTAAIEKHVTYLDPESMSSVLKFLSSILRNCLQGEHASAEVAEYQNKYPELDCSLTPMAIATKWRLDVLGELIRSSQMQLRMMAVTATCHDLITIWKTSSNIEGAVPPVLKHIGSYLLQSQLIDYILSPSCHPEIIAESGNIVGFLVMTQMYTMEQTERLWQGIKSSQDPRIADALTRMVTVIANLFDYSTCVAFCEQLRSLPIEDFTHPMRRLWEELFKNMLKKVFTTLTIHPYNLCLRLLRESCIPGASSQVAHTEVFYFVLSMLDPLWDHGPDATGRHELYRDCMDDVAAKSKTTLGSLWFLLMAIRSSPSSEIQVLAETYNLTRLLVEELEHAAKAADGLAVLSGPANEPRRDLVAHVIRLQPATLEGELGLRLWNVLVGPQSSCLNDQATGWGIISNVANITKLNNPYLQTCLSQFLATLPPSCFSLGMLELIKREVLPLVSKTDELILDDANFMSQGRIEQLWRVIDTANDENLVHQSIRTLASEIYIDSPSIRECPRHRALQVHLSLVNRCLSQLKEAARRLRASSVGVTSSDDDLIVVVPAEEQTDEQERIFTRSLQLLRYFLEAHQQKPRFATADLRSLMSDAPLPVEGDLAELKYQSFDGTSQTDVRPLNVGKLNTAASLLASLRQETGFDNYRAYYKGQQFHPTERDICRSLEDLHVHDGLILVKRDADGAPLSARIKPGSSSLEIEILSHFNELWAYLSMEENLAKEIYGFLTRLPAHGSIMELFENDDASFQDVFPRGEVFKALYAIHALREYISAARHANANGDGTALSFTSSSYEDAVKKSLSLVTQAIADDTMFEDQVSNATQMHLITSLMQVFLNLLHDMTFIERNADNFDTPPAGRLMGILSDAASSKDETGFLLASSTLAAITRLGVLHRAFWDEISSDDAFGKIVIDLVLYDTRPLARETVSQIILDAVNTECQQNTNAVQESSAGTRDAYPIMAFFWNMITNAIPEAENAPGQCRELFQVSHSVLKKIPRIMPEVANLPKLLQQTTGLLLNHTSIEAIDDEEPCDLVAMGLTSLSLLCVQMEDSLCSSSSLSADLAQHLFTRHLFPQERSQPGQPVPAVILNTNTRSQLCNLILRLVRNDGGKLKQTLTLQNELIPFDTDDGNSPYLYDLPFTFDRTKWTRSSTGFVGLKNLSNTCYLNSLLTQLYMNIGLREFMLGVKTRDPWDSQSLLFNTQKVFAYMQESYARFIDPADLVASIKTYDDTPIDIHNQMDVDEFYNLLFDRWEAQMPTNDERKMLRSFYGGQLVQQVKSKECEHVSEILEPFSAIQCDVKGKNTLQDSLQAYVDGEIMEGDNKYKCSTCDRHVDAVKR
jgi:ubiquitin carboxyl-terminal hydrolase 34